MLTTTNHHVPQYTTHTGAGKQSPNPYNHDSNSPTRDHDAPYTTLKQSISHGQYQANPPILHTDTDVAQDTSETATLDGDTNNHHQADKDEDTSLDQAPSETSDKIVFRKKRKATNNQ